MKKVFIALLLLLGACTFQVTVPSTPSEPVAPVETPVEPDINSGGAVVIPEETPVFSDPADLVVNATFNLLASPNGTGDCLTISTPCSLETAARRLEPGQILMLRGGLYPAGTAIKLETSDNTTEIKAYPNETPVIDGSYIPNVPGLSVAADNIIISGLDFRYSWTGLLTEGRTVQLKNLHAYANRVEGIYAKGSRPILSNIESNNNSVGVKVEGSIPVVRYVKVYDNDQGLLVNANDPIVEYVSAYNNKQGIISTSGFIRYCVALNNESGILSVAGALVYNNTVVGGQQSFVSSTSSGQEAASFFLNLISGVPAPSLTYDTDLSNSWDMNITDPGFVSLDPDSPLFARVRLDSPVLNIAMPEGVPVSNASNRLGAYGTP